MPGTRPPPRMKTYGIVRAAEPLQRRVAERVEVAGLRAVRHRRDAHAPGRRQQIRHVERRRREKAAELETRRNDLLFPFVAVRQHAIGAGRIGLRRHGVRARVLHHLALFDRHDRLAGLAVEHEQHAVGSHGGDELARTPADLRVVEHRRLRDVGFPDVMPNGLVVPLQLAGLDVECDERAEIEVVPGAEVAGVLRDAVARAEVHQAEVRIGCADQPQRAAADLPGVVVFRPRLVPGFAGSGHGEPFPDLLAGLAVNGDDFSAEPRIGRRADEHQAARVDRRPRYALSGTSRLDAAVHIPHLLACLFPKRDHMRVAQTDVDKAVADGDAFARRQPLFGPGEIGEPRARRRRARLMLPHDASRSSRRTRTRRTRRS